ncbi:hypothetical protein D3C79_987540 [compost metagenome]
MFAHFFSNGVVGGLCNLCLYLESKVAVKLETARNLAVKLIVTELCAGTCKDAFWNCSTSCTKRVVLKLQASCLVSNIEIFVALERGVVVYFGV